MSGIAAIAAFEAGPSPRSVLGRMAQRAAHRGPDGTGIWDGAGTGIAHLALHATPGSRLEPEPLYDPAAGLVVAADARLDNRDDLAATLRADLPPAGAVSDARLVLAAYRRWGPSAAARLLGDFAFVVWETAARRLYAARDPLGIRPLYFARLGRVLAVASEAQQILAHPAAPAGLDDVAIAGWLAGRPDNERCLFAGIEPVPPGHTLVATAAGQRLERYWRPDLARRIRYRRTEDYEHHLRDLLSTAVADRLRTDAPVIGTELSGGMDSTTVTALARHALPGGGPRLLACTQQFRTVRQCDETDYARAVADHLGVEMLVIDAERHGALGYPENQPPSLEHPAIFEDPTLGHQLDRLRAAGARVLLTGNGGDEVTTGSEYVYLHRVLRGDWSALGEIADYCAGAGLSLPRTLYSLLVRPVVSTPVHEALRRLVDGRRGPSRPWPRWVSDRAAARLEIGRRFFRPARKRLGTVAQEDMVDGLVGGALPGVVGTYDLTAGRRGMEARHPFLDLRVVEFALAVPPTLWVRGDYRKWLLRRATRGLLPDAVRWRVDKTAFGAIYGIGVRSQRGYVDRALGHPYPREIGLLDSGTLRDELWSYYERHDDLEMSDLYSAMTLMVWLDRHYPAAGSSPVSL